MKSMRDMAIEALELSFEVLDEQMSDYDIDNRTGIAEEIVQAYYAVIEALNALGRPPFPMSEEPAPALDDLPF